MVKSVWNGSIIYAYNWSRYYSLKFYSGKLPDIEYQTNSNKVWSISTESRDSVGLRKSG